MIQLSTFPEKSNLQVGRLRFLYNMKSYFISFFIHLKKIIFLNMKYKALLSNINFQNLI